MENNQGKEFLFKSEEIPDNSDNISVNISNNKEMFKNCLYEIWATFLFVLIIYFCKGDVNKFSFGFFVILVLFEKCSGPHLNPCFTIGYFVYNNKINLEGIIEILLYIFSQILGAILGSLLSLLVDSDNLVYTVINEELSVFSIIFTEFFFTATLIFVILFVVSDITKPSKDTVINCAIVICWFFMIVNAGNSISGASYNPALLIVLNTVAYFNDKPKAFQNIIYMIISEIIGGLLAALVFKHIYEPYYAFKHRIIIKRKSKLLVLNNTNKNSII